MTWVVLVAAAGLTIGPSGWVGELVSLVILSVVFGCTRKFDESREGLHRGGEEA